MFQQKKITISLTRVFILKYKPSSVTANTELTSRFQNLVPFYSCGSTHKVRRLFFQCFKPSLIFSPPLAIQGYYNIIKVNNNQFPKPSLGINVNCEWTLVFVVPVTVILERILLGARRKSYQGICMNFLIDSRSRIWLIVTGAEKDKCLFWIWTISFEAFLKSKYSRIWSKVETC